MVPATIRTTASAKQAEPGNPSPNSDNTSTQPDTADACQPPPDFLLPARGRKRQISLPFPLLSDLGGLNQSFLFAPPKAGHSSF